MQLSHSRMSLWHVHGLQSLSLHMPFWLKLLSAQFAGAIPDAATTDPVPPHPAAPPVGPVRQVLPQDLQHQLEMNLNTTLQPVVQHLRRVGLTEADAVNEARGLAWHHLHNMDGLTSRHTKTRRAGTSESSRGWY